MYLATKSSSRSMTLAQALQHAPMTARISSGSSRADSAVEPTRSANMTVSCRRAAKSVAVDASGVGDLESAADGPDRSSIAVKSLRRSPTATTPSSFKSSVVNFGRTSASILFSLNDASYSPRPRLRSHLPTSMVMVQNFLAHDRPGLDPG